MYSAKGVHLNTLHPHPKMYPLNDRSQAPPFTKYTLVKMWTAFLAKLWESWGGQWALGKAIGKKVNGATSHNTSKTSQYIATKRQPCPQKVRRIGGRKEVWGEKEGRSGDSADTSRLPYLFSLLRSDKYELPTSSPSCAQTHPGCQLFLPLALRRIRAANFFSLLLSDTSGLPTNSPSCTQTHPGCQLILPLALRHIRAANFFSLLRSDQSGLPTSSPSYAQTNPGCHFFSLLRSNQSGYRLVSLLLSDTSGLPTYFPLAPRHIRAANLISLLRSNISGLPSSFPSCSQTHPGCQLILPLG
uniref:Uncharacterized protein n=1 Tax=Timema shepardi TaxID=629360 RepID=A0A7R9AKJ9_TIMSH|nr:unnamed protein product [Timema shepardi]